MRLLLRTAFTKLSHTAGGLKNRMVGRTPAGNNADLNGLADLLAGNEQAADELKSGVTSVIDTIRTLIPQFAELTTSIAGAVLESAPGIIKRLRTDFVGYLRTYSDHRQNCDRDYFGSGGTVAADSFGGSGYSAVAYQGALRTRFRDLFRR